MKDFLKDLGLSYCIGFGVCFILVAIAYMSYKEGAWTLAQALSMGCFGLLSPIGVTFLVRYLDPKNTVSPTRAGHDGNESKNRL